MISLALNHFLIETLPYLRLLTKFTKSIIPILKKSIESMFQKVDPVNTPLVCKPPSNNIYPPPPLSPPKKNTTKYITHQICQVKETSSLLKMSLFLKCFRACCSFNLFT